MSHSIIPVHLAIKAMRDNGYKTAAHAIAELIDNSIQAGASIVELLCSEDVSMSNGKRTIRNIAVLDNGTGMDLDQLQKALQFGNGSHLNPKDQKGMGRFGMGLPAASISIAKRVDVWSWQNGINSAIHTYIDIDEIISQKMIDVPQPIKKEVPYEFIDAALLETIRESGTLVVWDKIDRYQSKSLTLFKSSELLIGRMYRYFISNGDTKIRMYSFNKKIPADSSNEFYALANDPLYIMKETSCPEPYDVNPMFREYPDKESFTFEIPYSIRGEKESVTIKYSIAKEESRKDFRNAGSTPYGKHAAKNIGVSIVRAGRELNLDTNICVGYDPRERWWGCEVSFPPALDDIFGVTNNKQSANKFSEVAIDIKNNKSVEDRNISYQEEQEELSENNEGIVLLYKVINTIHTQISSMRGLIEVQKKKISDPTRYTTTPEDTATARTDSRVESGRIGTSDSQDTNMSIEEKQEDVMAELNSQELDIETKEEIITGLFNPDHKRKYQFIKGRFATPDFFSVSPRGGKIIITLNVEHPAYKNLIEVLDEVEIRNNTIDDLQSRLLNASDGLKLLLMAWARYEDEEPVGVRKDNVQNARTDWGRVAREFLRSEE